MVKKKQTVNLYLYFSYVTSLSSLVQLVHQFHVISTNYHPKIYFFLKFCVLSC